MNAEIDLVVVDYHTPQDLAAFMRSTSLITVPHTLTVVVVEDEPYDWIPEDIVLSSPENIGYARACNWGATVGEAPVLALFNADVTLLPGGVERCLEVMCSSPDIAVVGPRQRDHRARLTHAGIVGGNRNARPRGWRENDRGQYSEDEDVTSVSGSAYFVKRHVWEEMADCPLYRRADPGSMGAFLRTPHYYEETWLSYHVRHHGYRVVYAGSTTLLHEWHRASPVGGWAERQFEASREIFRRACDMHGIEHD